MGLPSTQLHISAFKADKLKGLLSKEFSYTYQLN